MKVNPKKVLLAAIASPGIGTIENGFHLRAFIGSDLVMPDIVFPPRE